MYEYFLKNKLKKIYRKETREKCFLNWKDIHTVVVLFDTSHFEEGIIFVDQLKKEGKEVTVYAYQRKRDKRNYSSTGYHIISEKEIGKWFNNPFHANIKKLKKKTVDAVIDLTICQIIPMEYLLAHIPASVKTGQKKTESPQYDLAITTSYIGEAESYQVMELSRQIMYYLDRIGSG